MTSSTITRRYATLLALGALAVGVAAPNAAAHTGPPDPPQGQPAQDLRSPDARDAATASGPSPVSVSSGQDLRSPDTRDVAAGYHPEPVAVAAPEPSGSGEGFDWVSAAIGAAAFGGLSLLLVVFMSGRGGQVMPRIGRRGAAGA
jgi:hypothetical protein